LLQLDCQVRLFDDQLVALYLRGFELLVYLLLSVASYNSAESGILLAYLTVEALCTGLTLAWLMLFTVMHFKYHRCFQLRASHYIYLERYEDAINQIRRSDAPAGSQPPKTADHEEELKVYSTGGGRPQRQLKAMHEQQEVVNSLQTQQVELDLIHQNQQIILAQLNDIVVEVPEPQSYR